MPDVSIMKRRPSEESKAPSRNDLFSVDWSPQLPNVRSSNNIDANTAPALLPTPETAPLAGSKPEPPLLQLNLPLTPPLDETVWQGFNEYTTSPNAASTSTRPNSFMSASSSTTSPVSSASWSTRESKRLAPPGPNAGRSSNPVLDSRINHQLRLSPTREYLLGQGRHASVFLASWIPANDVQRRKSEGWSLCAAKRMRADPESQVSGLGEAFILAKLSSPIQQSPSASSPSDSASIRSLDQGSRHIMTLYGVKDERDGVQHPGSSDVTPPRIAIVKDTTKAKPGAGLQVQARRAASEKQPRRFFSNGRMLSPPPPSPQDPTTTPTATEEKGRSFGFFDAMSRKKAPRISVPPAPARSSLSGPERLDDEEEEVLAEKTSSLSVRRQKSGTGPTSLSSSPNSKHANDTAHDATPRIILLLEFCPYGHLTSYIRANPESIGLSQWLEWAKQLAVAVAWCHHRGVLHADIKPQNVLIARDMTLKLSDFGMSMFIPSPSSGVPLPSDPHGLGTPPYSPPEFVRPLPSPFSFPSDIFSLGVTLSVMISGTEPYEGLRTVERMMYVSRGAYYEYEERRRLGMIGRPESTRSDAGSRAGSIRSVTHHRNSFGQSSNGEHSQRTRSESIDSNVSVVSDLYRPTWHVSSLANRLLVRSDGSMPANDDSNGVEPCTTPTRQLSLVENERHFPPTTRAAVTSQPPYADGTPAQYFLNGTDVVPASIRNLLRAMTQPRPESRPSAKQVLRWLESVSTQNVSSASKGV